MNENTSDKIPENDYLKDKINTKELSRGFQETLGSIKNICDTAPYPQCNGANGCDTCEHQPEE